MADEPALLYLEPDDEITSLVRRLRQVDAGRVVIVAPGRAKATSSATALRLLARIAGDEGRDIAVVGDTLTRSLAAEADLTAFASVEDARTARPAPAAEPQRAAINVLRSERAHPAGDAPTAVSTAAPPALSHPAGPPGRGDETRAVPLARAPRPRARHAPVPQPQRKGGGGRRWALAGLAVVLLAFLVVGGGIAAIAPSATITIQTATQAVGPVRYELRFERPTMIEGVVELSIRGTAGGTYEELEPAAGAVTFFNWNFVPVTVGQGTGVAAGDVAFATTETITVPAGQLLPPDEGGTIRRGEMGVNVVATEPGSHGNVPAGAIDTILDRATAAALRGFPQNTRALVENPGETAGGIHRTGPVIREEDLDAALTSLHDDLLEEAARRVAAARDDPHADPAEVAEPQIAVPDGLVGRRDEPAFMLDGTLAYARATVASADVDDAARTRLTEDAGLLEADRRLVADTIRVSIDNARLDGTALVVPVEVSAASEPVVDDAAVLEAAIGLPVAEVRDRLGRLGAVTVQTWPEWVDTIPQLDWRVSVVVLPPVPEPDHPEPTPSAS